MAAVDGVGDEAQLPEPDIMVLVEGEGFKMHSQVLALSSPVFCQLLSSGMLESHTRQIELPGKSKEEFRVFQSFLQPVAGRQARIVNGNVDMLLPWFDEYQVVSLKRECETLLLTMPCNIERLVQAARFNLHDQYKRCLREIAQDPTKWSPLWTDEIDLSPGITKDLLKELQPVLLAVHDERMKLSSSNVA